MILNVTHTHTHRSTVTTTLTKSYIITPEGLVKVLGG